MQKTDSCPKFNKIDKSLVRMTNLKKHKSTISLMTDNSTLDSATINRITENTANSFIFKNLTTWKKCQNQQTIKMQPGQLR